MKKNRNEEYKLCKMLSDFLYYQFPNIAYHFDYGSGTKLTIGQAMQQKNLNPYEGYPDLIIPKPRKNYKGFFLEVKKEGEKIFKVRKPNEYKSEHLQQQARFLEHLRKDGYYAEFGIGYEDCTKQILNYLT